MEAEMINFEGVLRTDVQSLIPGNSEYHARRKQINVEKENVTRNIIYGHLKILYKTIIMHSLF